jgi:CubicO group peptidase (beta-lactamase class C family)
MYQMTLLIRIYKERKMMDHANKPKLFAVFVFALIVLLYAAVAPLGHAQENTQTTQTNAQSFYEDPKGRFTVPVPTNWSVETRDTYTFLTDPDEAVNAYLLVTTGEDIAQAIANAWQTVDPTFNATVSDTQSPPSSEGIEETLIVNYTTPRDRIVQGFGQRYEGNIYVLLFDGDASAVARRSSQLNIIVSGLELTGLEKINLANATPKPFDETMQRELEGFILSNIEKADIPGAVVAVVQNGEVVYEGAFGVKEKGNDDPMTIDTNMLIGSTGKSLTTLMMGTVVDDGNVTWDTPARDIFPDFAVQDPQLSETITMRNLVCACTGVPRRDLEFIFNGNALSAEDMVTSLKGFEFSTDFGEAFQYSNQMVATGGYLAALADGSEDDDLFQNYADVMQAKVLDPIGMKDTTVSFDSVLERGNYALPHSNNLADERVAMPFDQENLLNAAAPAGGSWWSTAPDMARYMVTQLNKGVSSNGERVISEENLLLTWQPQVPINSTMSYGLGWIIAEYKGARVIEHGGNTLGFTSGFGFLPDKNIGVLVLTNVQNSNVFNDAVRERVLELVFEQSTSVEEKLEFALSQEASGLEGLQASFVELDAVAVEPFVGTYQNDALGEMTLSLDGDTLELDAGEIKSALQPYDADGRTVYAFADPPLASATTAGFGFELRLEGEMPVIDFIVPPDVYTFTRED